MGASDACQLGRRGAAALLALGAAGWSVNSLRGCPHGWRGATPTMVETAPAYRIDVNSASPAELALLPRIGPALAERIALERMEGGPFSSLDQLRRVRGVGDATIEALAPFAVARHGAER